MGPTVEAGKLPAKLQMSEGKNQGREVIINIGVVLSVYCVRKSHGTAANSHNHKVIN